MNECYDSRAFWVVQLHLGLLKLGFEDCHDGTYHKGDWFAWPALHGGVYRDGFYINFNILLFDDVFRVVKDGHSAWGKDLPYDEEYVTDVLEDLGRVAWSTKPEGSV